jgi:antagonist of KipI
MLTTVQDLGRWGHQGDGVPVAGPMDAYSHRLANAIVGNSVDAAALEITLIGPELEAREDVVCAVTGARFAIAVDGAAVPLDASFPVRSGSRIRFGARSAGARATLAVAGGIVVEMLYGSRATSLSAQLGPFKGRALRRGDLLPIGADRRTGHRAPRPGLPLPAGGARLRVIPGPHDRFFAANALDQLFKTRFVVTPNSNRMGYRLEGPSLELAAGADAILSDATPIGSIQVPPSGQPILLMADRQTTGGYPRIATVISADLPLAGQLAPDDWIEFAPIARDDALAELRHQRAMLEETQ